MSGFSIAGWAATAPGWSDKAAWLEFLGTARPLSGDGPLASENLPVKLRRRMGPLSRITVEAALRCCRESGIPAAGVPAVFASRHGELPLLVKLFRQLAEQDPLSPAAFANSVHHAPAGYFGIAAGNRTAARSISGGEASFCYGFLEALGLLAESRGGCVLLAAGEVAVPPPFDSLVPGPPAHAVAFLLRPDSGPGTFSLRLAGPEESAVAGPSAASVGSPALDFLRWSLQGEGELLVRASGRDWIWRKQAARI